MTRTLLGALALATAALPAAADTADTNAATAWSTFGAPAANTAPARVTLAQPQRAPTLTAIHRDMPVQIATASRAAWKALFTDLRAARHDAAAARLADLPASPLTAFVQAELLLARGTAPGVTDDAAFLAANPALPQAPRLAARFGMGAATLPTPAILYPVWESRAAAKARARGDRLEAAVNPLVAAEHLAEAEAAFTRLAPGADEPTRTEFAHKIAWAHYRAGDDAAARRMGDIAATGTGAGAALGAWTAGLAAWRTDDCAAAAVSFDTIATKAPEADMASAAAYWAARAHAACQRPEIARARFQTAANTPHTFYGLLARRQLGVETGLDWSEPDFIKADWNQLAQHPGAMRAVALVEIGQLGLADRELRHLATVTQPTDYGAILRLAARLSLPATQLWLSARSPTGAAPPLSARFPAPDWTPPRGWRVDQALVYAHALQESRFLTDVVSRAGARGVMQVLPSTAAQITRDWAGAPGSSLSDPAFNLECGQSYLERLRDMSYTGGLLPKVIAAYNAGPGSVQKWNVTVRDNGDPLLFIESIPFKETRAYVEIVLRNLWMYELRDGRKPASMDALAQGLWPRFPGMPGALAVKLERSGMVMAARP